MENRGGVPEATAIGDVTGDGRNDAVMVTSTGFGADIEHRIFVFEQTTAGLLKAPVDYPYSAGLYETADNFQMAALALADLDRNDIQDIVVGYGKGIAIFLADGLGGFTSSKHLIAAQFRNLEPVEDNYWVKHVAITDIDRDGALDVVAHNGHAGATLFFGNGQGGVVEIQAMDTPGTGISDVKLGDATGDGHDDVVVLAGASASRKFWVLPNMGARGFGQPQINYLSSEWPYSSIAIADWDQDGVNEIMVALSVTSTSTPPPRLLLHERGADGMYTVAASFTTRELPKAMLSEDLDGDQIPDLLVEHRNSVSMSFYSANGFASELPVNRSHIDTPDHSAFLSAGDLNADGCKDIAFPSWSNGLIVLPGQNCELPVMSSGNCRLMEPMPSLMAASSHAASPATAAQGWRRQAPMRPRRRRDSSEP